MSKELHKAAVVLIKTECRAARRMVKAESDKLGQSRTDIQKESAQKAAFAKRLEALEYTLEVLEGRAVAEEVVADGVPQPPADAGDGGDGDGGDADDED